MPNMSDLLIAGFSEPMPEAFGPAKDESQPPPKLPAAGCESTHPLCKK
jgi:hypothetical protein